VSRQSGDDSYDWNERVVPRFVTVRSFEGFTALMWNLDSTHGKEVDFKGNVARSAGVSGGVRLGNDGIDRGSSRYNNRIAGFDVLVEQDTYIV
jgi:hypothetical protein